MAKIEMAETEGSKDCLLVIHDALADHVGREAVRFRDEFQGTA